MDTTHTFDTSLRVAAIAIIGVFVALLAFLFDETVLANDFAQTASVASNLLSGNGLATSLIYYDIHYELGSDTVPQTVFPPGYSLLIAPLIFLGVSPGLAGFVICVSAFALTAFLIERAVNEVTHSPSLAALSAVTWAILAVNWSNVLICRSEMPATLLATASVYCVCRWSARGGVSRSLLVLAGAAAAAAFLVRYQSAFLILSLGAVFFVRAIPGFTLRKFWDLAAVSAAPAVIVALLFGRNYMISGGFGGGPIDHVQTTADPLDVIRVFYYASGEILGVSIEGLLRGGLAEISLMILLAFGVWAVFRPGVLTRIPKALSANTGVVFCVVFLLISIAAFATLALVKSLGYVQARYFSTIIPFVIVPFFVVLAAVIRAKPSGKPFRFSTVAGVVLLSGSLVLGQASAMQGQISIVSERAGYYGVQAALDTEFRGENVGTFLASEISAGNNVLAYEGQLVGYIIQKPVFGLAHSGLTAREFDEEEVLATAASRDIRYLVFFPSLYSPSLVKHSNQTIFTQIHSGETFESLEPLIETDRVSVFAITN